MYPQAILFIQDLAIIMLIAATISVICHQLKQPVVLGYILCGIIIGPHTPPFSFIHQQDTIKTLAELGVIFIMFSLGLEFDLHKLKKVGFTAFIAAFSEIILMIWLGYGIGQVFGWSTMDAIFLGAILAISSTTIIVKALGELDLKKKSFAKIIFGILIVEDIFAIALLVLLSGIAIHGSLQIQDLVTTSAKLLSFLVFSLLLGILIIPKFIAYISKYHSRESLLISVLGLCFGFCLLVVKLDYSIALGAFLMGAIIAESRQVAIIEQLIMPIRDMFSAIFFVSVGLLLDPKALIEYFVPIVIITAAVVVGKIFSCSLGVFLTGHDAKTSMRVGMGMAQIGEFSFIIAALGITLGVSSNFLFPIAVAVSVLTTFLTPYLIKHSDQITPLLYKIIPLKVSGFFNWYTTWLQNIQTRQIETGIRKIVRRSLVQTALNLFIIIGIFLGVAYLANTDWIKLMTHILNENIYKTLAWSAAVILSLPFIVGIYRKIKALSMLLAEFTVRKKVDQVLPLTTRRIIAEIIPIISLVVILLFVFALSVSILPPIELLIISSGFIIILVVLLYSRLVKLHAKLQIRFLDAMKKESDHSDI